MIIDEETYEAWAWKKNHGFNLANSYNLEPDRAHKWSVAWVYKCIHGIDEKKFKNFMKKKYVWIIYSLQ